MNLVLNNGEVVEVLDGKVKYVLAKLLSEAMDEIGHPLTFSEARAYPRMPKDVNLYATQFGDLERACMDAYYVVRKEENPESLVVQHELSAVARAVKSREFQAELIRKAAEESNERIRRWKMDKREEVMERVMRLCFEHGNDASWISDEAIKRDPILVHRDVMKAFGGVKQLKAEAKKRLWEEKHGKKSEKAEKKDIMPAAPAVETPVVEVPAVEEVPESTEGVVKMAEKRKYTKKTDEQLWAEIREKAHGLRRVPTDAEIRRDNELSATGTYYNRLGSDWKAVIARELESEMEEKDMAGATETAVEATAPEEVAQEVVETAEAADTADVDETADTDEATIAIPIKVIVPKGIKGSIQINLEF